MQRCGRKCQLAKKDDGKLQKIFLDFEKVPESLGDFPWELHEEAVIEALGTPLEILPDEHRICRKHLIYKNIAIVLECDSVVQIDFLKK